MVKSRGGDASRGDGVRIGRRRRSRLGALGAMTAVAAALTISLAACSPVSAHPAAHTSHKHHSKVQHLNSTPTETPDPADSRPATPDPADASQPAPTLTPVPAGTVVAEGDVASPKGSIHFHYRVAANGDNTYTAQYSNFTSTVPVPVSVTLLDVPPKVGDGLTWHGVGDHQLGGPTTSPASSSASLGSEDEPSYLTSLVTYSSAASFDGVPVELGPNKVLAVDTVQWNVPVRQSNVHPVDGGTRTYAAGTVTATTSSGAPKSYRIAPGDITSFVAKRFGISVQDLIWLNTNLQVFGDQQYLYAGTTLNLDPNSI
ncbi:LysM peptidoglycan-binding domain-containing protein [Humibacter albus]|uniref:LysM peptidoglycan-binding domain-containing protein n=1 Tax=Humibacter albus TaxID=427754 RepID=UPI0003B2EB5C|nr:LysM peptidoglycan-binding domain-containing protein [Humibacter albus]